jgi:hypothetical protein
MEKRLPLSYRMSMVKYTNNVLNKKNFFSVFSVYFVLFFDFSGIDKNSFYSIILKLRKNQLLGKFVQVKRFLTKTLSFVPSMGGKDFVQLKVNELLLSNDTGFIGLLVLDREAFFSKVNTIFSFYDFCYLHKFVNPFGKKFVLESSALGLDFFFKPLFVKLSNFLICPRVFDKFIHVFYVYGDFSVKVSQIRKLIVFPRLFFFFFISFFKCFLLFRLIRK